MFAEAIGEDGSSGGNLISSVFSISLGGGWVLAAQSGNSGGVGDKR
jgi:hypothetical protein